MIILTVVAWGVLPMGISDLKSPSHQHEIGRPAMYRISPSHSLSVRSWLCT